MPSYQKPTRAEMIASVRRQLADPTGRWWSDSQLAGYVEAWQTDINNKYEFIVSTATVTMTGSEFNVPTDCQRVTWVLTTATNGTLYTIPPTSESVLSRVSSEWRFEWGYEPGAWVQTTASTIQVWPAQLANRVFEVEYTKKFLLPNDATQVGVPAFCKWHGVCEVMRRAYLALGPNYDLKRSLRWKARASKWERLIGKIQNSRWGAVKYPSLKPSTTQWEAKIVRPSIVISELHMPSTSSYGTIVIPTGNMDGSNVTFTLPTIPVLLILVVNGLVLHEGVGYTRSGTVLTLATPPESDAVIEAVIW